MQPNHSLFLLSLDGKGRQLPDPCIYIYVQGKDFTRCYLHLSGDFGARVNANTIDINYILASFHLNTILTVTIYIYLFNQFIVMAVINHNLPCFTDLTGDFVSLARSFHLYYRTDGNLTLKSARLAIPLSTSS